ncbi:ribonuclease MRP protein subunit rmp1 [Chaetomidium leptoderma]|uniref:Ribonuclease MRP protein subunit rmp1 n=1 Tax=Chaetomidium leptoderma TaxID=669021 RepID=A0AAN6VLY9_9PEZI|nr:ribonuclease MRP protein subunit rmp1 [Chaetomidium leptoderma]
MSDPGPPPILDPEALNCAIASLSPALEILERFHHRNKNQHRLSKWWAQADMLRRHVRKLLGELEAGVVEAERLARLRAKGRQMATKRKKGGSEGGGGLLLDGGEEEGNGVVRRRAEYLRWRLGPGAFLAFTQLSADRMFAHLGLMLLGVLAQVDKTVAPFAPPPPSDAPPSSRAEPEPQAAAAAAATEFNPPGETAVSAPDQDQAIMMMDTDMGVAVSREEILLSIERDPTPRISTTTPVPTPISAQTHPRSISLPINPPSKKKPTAAATAKTEPPSKESSPAEPVIKVTTTKRKKIKTGDEFDDIFGSLDGKSSSKKPKKKKRKKGDEFDDIFGGL